MLPPADRGYLYKLRREECHQLLTKLGLEIEGSVAVLRVKLLAIAKKADLTEDEIKIFQDGKKQFVDARENMYIKTWVYNIPEEECREMLTEFNIEASENEDQNRTKLEQHLNKIDPNEKENWIDYAKEFCKDLEEDKEAKSSTTKQPPKANNNDTIYEDPVDPANAAFQGANQAFVDRGEDASTPINPRRFGRNCSQQTSELAVLLEQARKWKISFNGKGKPQEALKFLKKVKDQAICYQICEDKLQFILPALLQEDAESWYQCTNHEWSNWQECEDSFKLFFLPAKMREEMSDEVRTYLQGKNQPIKDFILQIKTRMSYIPAMTPKEQLDRIYKNLSVDYQLHIKRSEFCTLEELIRLGEDFEDKLQKQNCDSGSKFRSQEIHQNNNRPNQHQRPHIQRNFFIKSENPNEEEITNQESTSGESSKKYNPFRADTPAESKPNNITSPNEEDQRKSEKPSFVCYNCDKPGHTSRYCRVPRRPYCHNCKKKGVNNCNCSKEKKPLNICTMCKESGHTEKECPEIVRKQSSGSVMTFRQGALGMSTDRRPRRKIEIADKTFTAVLDTGATTSYINKSVQEHLIKKEIEATPIKVITRLANGLDTSTNQVYHLDIKLADKVICQNLLVLEGMNEEMIIGCDALEKFGFQLIEQEMPEKGECVHELKKREELDLADWNSWETRGNEIIKWIPKDEQIKNIFPKIECCAALNSDLELSVEQKERLKLTLEENFKKFEGIRDCTNLVEHKIRMKTNIPIRLRYSPKNPKMQQIISRQVDDLLLKGLIEPSASEYCSPIVLVKKKDATWRMCVDFRKINENSERDSYPIPHIQNTLNRLKKAQVVSALDLKNGYWQVPISAESRQYTAFIVPGRGLFQWRVMPFGLHSAPATFQRFLDLLISQAYVEFAVAYLDDIIIFSENFDDHLKHVSIILTRLAEANLQINKDKSVFCQRKLKYLGHLVGEGGIQTDPEKVRAIEELPPPKDISGVRRIIGMAGWYSAFLPNYTEVIAPLNQLLTKNAKFIWGEPQQKALDEIKSKMKTAPILACPDYNKQFYLQTDASNIGLGAVLFQREGNHERVIAYRSRSLQPHERNYTTTEKECLAVVWAIQRNLEFLEGIPFTVITDHLALKWIFKLPNPTGRLGRWSLELRNHDFTIQYRKGKQNVVPDALSRHPLPLSEEFEELCASSSKEIIECSWLSKKIELVTANPEKFPEYTVENGQLLKNCGVGELEETNWKLCVAEPFRKRVLEENHERITSGHLGIRKTVNRIQRKYYWPGLVRDVIKFVNNCKLCLEHKIPQTKPAGFMHSTKAHGPWDIVTLDFVGPLPKSKQSNCHILVMQDKFSKWVECIPLRVATSTGLTKALRERVCCHFGWPRLVITDNGSQFLSHKFKTFLQENGIWHQLTPPYSPQCNSTERANRVVKTMVRMYLEGDHRRWDENLPEIQFAINTAIQDSTGFSAAELNFGRQLRTANTFFEESLPLHQPAVEANSELAEKIKDLCAMAKRHMEAASIRQAKYYNLKKSPWTPDVGEQVYKRNFCKSNASASVAAKLNPIFSGPFTVVNFISPTVVELISSPHQKKTIRAHVKDLKQIRSTEKSDQN